MAGRTWRGSPGRGSACRVFGIQEGLSAILALLGSAAPWLQRPRRWSLAGEGSLQAELGTGSGVSGTSWRSGAGAALCAVSRVWLMGIRRGMEATVTEL